VIWTLGRHGAAETHRESKPRIFWMRLFANREQQLDVRIKRMNDRLTHRPRRSGQAMVEFAIISFLLTAMLSAFLGLIVLGLGSFQNNLAAESAGRLLA